MRFFLYFCKNFYKMAKQKRLLAIHDISCFGKCSLTVALPIISACGVETAIMPTAVLSTHTGGFTNFTYRDLTEDLIPIAKHWKSLNLEFEAIYTGFLGSFEQINIVSEIFEMFKKEDTIILVDPVMADYGKLYPIFPADFPDEMKKLCQKADIIIPNITEACLMLHEEYQDGPYTEDYIKNLLKKLSKICNNKIVLTGVYFDNENLGVATYDVKNDIIEYAFSKRIEGMYHGTGDVFGSALIGAILNGEKLRDAAQIAVDYTASSIQKTAIAKTDIRFGVNFEETTPSLIKSLNL